jgi:hypothetical protein
MWVSFLLNQLAYWKNGILEAECSARAELIADAVVPHSTLPGFHHFI